MSTFTKTLFVRTASLTAAAVLATATISFPAFAAAPTPDSVEVRIDDLNLSSPAGQAQLDRRIVNAINHVCGGPSSDLRERQARKACRAKARSDALAQVETKTSPALATR